MLKKDTTNDEEIPSITNLQTTQQRAVEIPNALPMRLQTLDVARHTVIDPDGNRYVVATYNDMYIGRGYVTAIYPQQNDYLTLVRLTLGEFINSTLEDAVNRHIVTAQTIQQGRLQELTKKKI